MNRKRAWQPGMFDPRQAGHAAVGAALLLSAAGACAQADEAGAGKQIVTVVPRISITETLTNNVNLSSVNAQSDQITEISPGVQIGIDGARLKAYFDYSLNHLYYAQGTSPSENQNSLNTFGTFEAVEKWAFIDFSGAIWQQTISAFGTQSNNNTAINRNQTEYANYRISPYVSGQFGNNAHYEARYSYSFSDGDNYASTTNIDSSIKLSNASAFGKLGWTADASRQNVDYSAGRETEADNVSLGLTYAIDPQLNVFANAGRESSNYTSIEKKDYDTWNVGLNWIISERTKLSAETGYRSYGDVHNLSFEHRSARTVWKYTDTLDIITEPVATRLGSIGNAYDLFFTQFASAEPDPIARAKLVSDYLQAYGISPMADVLSNYLVQAVSRERRQNLSFALLGIRDTVTFMLGRTETNRIDTVTSSIDSLKFAEVLTQQAYSVNYSHRLTPDYSLGLLLWREDTRASNSERESTLTTFSVNLAAKLGRRTSASLSLYRNVYDAQVNPYNETAASASLTVQF